MRNLLSNKIALAALGLGALLLSTPAGAHPRGFAVPVPFTVGDQVLPAGEYEITTDTAHLRLLIKSVDGKAAVFAAYSPGGVTRPAAKAGENTVQLTKYGTRYFLTGIWDAGSTEGMTVMTLRRVVQSAKAAAMRGVAGSEPDPQ
jgi:hypothetical protein